MRLLGALLLASILAGCGNPSVLATAGATTEGDGSGDDGDGGGDLDHTGSCAKIEGAQIGVENLTIEVGSKTLTFHSWVVKNGEAGEFIAFSYAQSGPLSIRVKAGTQTYDADGGGWENPDPNGHAISNVEGCDPDDDGGSTPDDPDGGSGDPPDDT